MTKERREYLNKPEVRERTRIAGRKLAMLRRRDKELNERIKLQKIARGKKNPIHRKPREQSTKSYREVIIYFLLDRDGINCGFCGEPVELDSVTLDHITPKFYGGKNRMDNLRLAHLLCNSSAGGKLRRQF
jgi:5-methylcytosine-specific restriction endonuclease McrA